MRFCIHTFLEELSRYSVVGPGVTRRAFTPESRAAWEYIIRTMRGMGLSVRTDQLGTVVGHLRGRREESILIGSHYDSVIQGGKYDGAVGIAVALAVAAHFIERGIMPEYSLDIIATNDEEGGTIADGFLSSKHMCGLQKPEKCFNETTGKTLAEYIAEGWYEKDGHGRDDICLQTGLKHVKRYIEAHIEQGGILWESGDEIGIVKHIVGITKLFVTVKGHSNHAGTTPMNMRADAMVAAAKAIAQIPELALRYEGAVATVGSIYCTPNSDNVIPGEVRFSVDIRSANDDDREALTNDIERTIREASQWGCEIGRNAAEVAVSMDPRLVDAMETVCRTEGIKYRVMNSGAGHDAQLFGLVLDAVMLFIPNRDGISHSPSEYARLEDINRAAHVIVKYLLWPEG